MPNSVSHPPALEGRTLLDELNHCIKIDLVSVINLVSFKGVSTDTSIWLRPHVEVRSILTIPDHDALVDAGEQLHKLGLATTRCKLDHMNIHLLLLAGDTLPLESAESGCRSNSPPGAAAAPKHSHQEKRK